MLKITSKDNSRLKHARSVRDGREKDLLFVEGLRLTEELAASRLKIVEYFFTPEFAASERGARLLSNLRSVNGAEISVNLLAAISETKTPSGIVAIAEKPAAGQAILEKAVRIQNPLLVVLHKLNNPANVGAIVRTAEAAGAAGAILTRDSTDVFAPRALRGAMGSTFRLPIWTNVEFNEVCEFCRAHQIKIISAHSNAAANYAEINWNSAKALIIGQEAHGLTAHEIAQTDESVRIPMRSPVESLNAAVACGVILYETARQRNHSV